MMLNESGPVRSKQTSSRRLTLLGSVAAIAMAVVIAAPQGYRLVEGAAAAPQSVENPLGPASFADLVARVKPAVISVRVKIDQAGDTTLGNQGDDENLPPEMRGTPFEKFFRQYGFENPPQGMPRHQMVMGEGSGFFISADGYAVTNNHVVDRAKSVQITTDDGNTYTARVIGTDAKTDLALIKVDGKTDFTYVNFEDHAPRIGDWVMAVGNPYGLGGTVTAGIVSANGRNIGSGPYDDYIQIDAPINKGNSGGPTFDMKGNVIGVNTAIFSPSGGSVGIGFDIPAETAKFVIAQLKDKGAVTRAWLGVQIQPVTAGIAESLGLKKAAGALVDSAQVDGPAAKAGIKAGDVITAVNGSAIKDSRDLAWKVSTLAPGSSAKLDVLRNGETKAITVALDTMPNQRLASAGDQQSGPTRGIPHLGLSVAPAGDVAGAGGQGVVVTSVDPDGPAAEHGIQSGDIILDVAGKSVANIGEMRSALSEAKSAGKHDVLMRVKSADTTRFVAVPIG
jgi:serine protease Do